MGSNNWQHIPVRGRALDPIDLVEQFHRPVTLALEPLGLNLQQRDGKFRLTPERLTLREMAAMGASLGISADGTYDLAAKQLDVSGVISPIYFVNAIGGVLSRRGEGLFGFTYRMTGPTSGPAVSVNPLSMFTPGALRRVFNVGDWVEDEVAPAVTAPGTNR